MADERKEGVDAESSEHPANQDAEKKSTDGIVASDAISALEQRFPLKELLTLDYFQRYRRSYYVCRDEGWQLQPRNYYNLLQFLTEIHEYRADDAKTFAKAFRTGANDLRNSDATFAEVIVYRYYVRLVYEGIIRSVQLGREECDVIVERLDGSTAFLEVFSIKPDRQDLKPLEFVIRNVMTHTQEAKSSVRQKLLRKIHKQKQMTKPRDNYAVIEINDVSIAGDFAVLSSLSSGYKVWLDPKTRTTVAEGYDWSSSVFDDDTTRHLKGVIYFDLGDYESRRFVHNPRFSGTGSTAV